MDEKELLGIIDEDEESQINHKNNAGDYNDESDVYNDMFEIEPNHNGEYIDAEEEKSEKFVVNTDSESICNNEPIPTHVLLDEPVAEKSNGFPSNETNVKKPEEESASLKKETEQIFEENPGETTSTDQHHIDNSDQTNQELDYDEKIDEEEEEEEDEEDDEGLKKPRGRSNHWSERAKKQEAQVQNENDLINNNSNNNYQNNHRNSNYNRNNNNNNNNKFQSKPRNYARNQTVQQQQQFPNNKFINQQPNKPLVNQMINHHQQPQQQYQMNSDNGPLLPLLFNPQLGLSSSSIASSSGSSSSSSSSPLSNQQLPMPMPSNRGQHNSYLLPIPTGSVSSGIASSSNSSFHSNHLMSQQQSPNFMNNSFNQQNTNILNNQFNNNNNNIENNRYNNNNNYVLPPYNQQTPSNGNHFQMQKHHQNSPMMIPFGGNSINGLFPRPSLIQSQHNHQFNSNQFHHQQQQPNYPIPISNGIMPFMSSGPQLAPNLLPPQQTINMPPPTAALMHNNNSHNIHLQQSSLLPSPPVPIQHMHPSIHLIQNKQQQQQQQQLHPISLPSQAQQTIKSVYINPSFIAKKPHEQQHPVNKPSDYPLQNQSNQPNQNNQVAPAKPRNRKDLDLLLEKRMELLSSENEEKPKSKTNPSSTSSSSLGVKRKSTENSSNVKHTKSNDSEKIHSNVPPKSSDKQIKTTESKKILSKVITTPTTHQQQQQVSSTESPPSKEQIPKNHSSMIVIDDPEYVLKIEEQKKKREQLLKLKEEKRNQRALEMKNKDESLHTRSSSSRTVISESSQPEQTVQKPKRVTSQVKAVNSTSLPISTTTATKRLIIQNLSLNTTSTILYNMCSSLNLKDKVKLKKYVFFL